jgi:hypothetical protein
MAEELWSFLFIGQYENHCGDAGYNAGKSPLPLMWLHNVCHHPHPAGR